MTKTAVLYVFHEINDRVKHFVRKCTFESPDIDFYIIANSLSIKFELPPHIKTMNRINVGYDFGGWSECLLKDDMYKKYDNFIFANSSIIGPFLKPELNCRWTDVYINGLKDNIKLFGSTINTVGFHEKGVYSHVQSYIFSMDREALEYLIGCGIFSTTNYAERYIDAIQQKEILMSEKIIKNGWNIGCLMEYYKGVDFTKTPNIPLLGDMMFLKYRGKIWKDEYELVFIKGNRINVTII
jgi:hypothetical protein